MLIQRRDDNDNDCDDDDDDDNNVNRKQQFNLERINSPIITIIIIIISYKIRCTL
jgi:hypothetical protein